MLLLNNYTARSRIVNSRFSGNQVTTHHKKQEGHNKESNNTYHDKPFYLSKGLVPVSNRKHGLFKLELIKKEAMPPFLLTNNLKTIAV